MKYLSKEYLKNCEFCVDRYAAIAKLRGSCDRIAEVGVLAGDFSENILKSLHPKELHLIDLYNCNDAPEYSRFKSKTHFKYVEQRFKKYIDDNVVHLKKGYSWDVLETYPDQYFDLIYIDAAHDYESVKRDLGLSLKKITPDGRIMLNDYIMYDHLANSKFGVVEATNEFCIKNQWEFEYFAFHKNLFCDVVLKKMEN